MNHQRNLKYCMTVILVTSFLTAPLVHAQSNSDQGTVIKKAYDTPKPTKGLSFDTLIGINTEMESTDQVHDILNYRFDVRFVDEQGNALNERLVTREKPNQKLGYVQGVNYSNTDIKKQSIPKDCGHDDSDFSKILDSTNFLKGVKYYKYSGWGATFGCLFNISDRGHECISETVDGILFEFEPSEHNTRINVGYGYIMYFGDRGMLRPIAMAFSVKGSYLLPHDKTGDFDRSSYNGLMLEFTSWNMGAYVGFYDENTIIGFSFRI